MLKKALLACALASVLPLCAQVKITQGEGKVSVSVNGKPFTDFVYQAEDYAKPYLWPILAADGTAVTRYWPMDKTHEGESTDHPHHRGLWFGHGEVNGFDFWANEQASHAKNPGKQIVKNVKVKSGGKTGTISCDIEWTGGGNVLLVEHRTMTFYSGEAVGPTNRQIDFDLRLEPKTKVTFGDTKEGTFSMRLAAPLEYEQKRGPKVPARTGLMVNAQGNKGEDADWGKRSEWMDYSGVINGEKLGIAIFDNPHNPGFPNRWHTRGYGLYGINPFGVHDFDKTATQAGGVTIEPGHELRYRFRVLIHPGDAETAKIGDKYWAWANR
jgi:hypothetical protein